MKIKTISIAILVTLFSNFLFSQDEIKGKWIARDLDNAVIQIYKENNLYFGKIIKSDIDDYIGKIILKNLKYNDSSKSWEGTIYSPKRKMDINGTLSLESENQLKVVGRKYFLTKTFYWVRKNKF